MATLHNDLMLQARHLSASQAEQNIRLGAYTRNGTAYWTGNATLSQSLQGIVTKLDVAQGTSGSQLRAVIGAAATTSVGSYTDLNGTYAKDGANLGADILALDTATAALSGTVEANVVLRVAADAVLDSAITALSSAARTQRNLDITNLIAGAPGTLNTLDEIAAALNDDATISGSLVTQIVNEATNRSNADSAIKGSGYSSGTLETLQDSRDDLIGRVHKDFRARTSGGIYYLDFGTGNNVPYLSMERNGDFVDFVVSHNGS